MSASVHSQGKLVIAHRGASGYLPEHTLAAKVLAHAQGAHYLEQDVVMTSDDELVVLHDITLDRVTDVATKFPGRQRQDGRFYVVDFTLAEIRQLKVSEAFNRLAGVELPLFPERFPLWASRFHINTLAEEIELIQGLNHTSGRKAGIYPEIKSPWFHHQEGKDISRAILPVLKQYGYDHRESGIFLQTFDFNELLRVKQELLPEFDMDIPLVQLIAASSAQETFTQTEDGNWVPYDYDWMHDAEGMELIARYADGVGPSMNMIVTESPSAEPVFTEFVSHAHSAGLLVHPYTFRQDTGRIPAYARDFEELLDIFLFQIDVDGVFTDYPDRAVNFLRSRGE
ncbi:MAG: glycerophosphodiester phosphodiesterase [Pseudohongiellaceae bacterium]